MYPRAHNTPIAVVDINTFVSGTTLSHQTYPGQVIDMWRHDNFILATSEPILSRMAQVYQYPKVKKITGMGSEEIDQYIEDVRNNSLVVAGTTPVNVTPDAEDNSLFSCAIETKANYIVSGDKKHVLPIKFYKGIRVVNARDFVEELILTRLTT